MRKKVFLKSLLCLVLCLIVVTLFGCAEDGGRDSNTKKKKLTYLISIESKAYQDILNNVIKDFNEIIEATNKYISKLKTLFILDSLDNLVKNGRISGVKAKVASLLHIVPIMGDNGNGEIELVEQVRGNKKAFNRLVEIIGEFNIDFENTILGITHSNAKEKAENLKKELLNRYKFKDILIFKAGGLSTVYADDGGIVVAF